MNPWDAWVLQQQQQHGKPDHPDHPGPPQQQSTTAPVSGTDASGDYLAFPTSDVQTMGMVLRRMTDGSFRAKVYVVDPSKPSIFVQVTPQGVPTVTLTDITTGQTVTLTAAGVNPTPPVTPVVRPAGIPT